MASISPSHSRLSELLAAQWPYVLTTVLAFAAAWLLQAVLKRDPLSSLPMVGSEIGNADKRRAAFFQGARNIYLEGYRKASSPTRTCSQSFTSLG
jgi:hypothetical protein